MVMPMMVARKVTRNMPTRITHRISVSLALILYQKNIDLKNVVKQFEFLKAMF